MSICALCAALIASAMEHMKSRPPLCCQRLNAASAPAATAVLLSPRTSVGLRCSCSVHIGTTWRRTGLRQPQGTSACHIACAVLIALSDGKGRSNRGATTSCQRTSVGTSLAPSGASRHARQRAGEPVSAASSSAIKAGGRVVRLEPSERRRMAAAAAAAAAAPPFFCSFFTVRKSSLSLATSARHASMLRFNAASSPAISGPMYRRGSLPCSAHASQMAHSSRAARSNSKLRAASGGCASSAAKSPSALPLLKLPPRACQAAASASASPGGRPAIARPSRLPGGPSTRRPGENLSSTRAAACCSLKKRRAAAGSRGARAASPLPLRLPAAAARTRGGAAAAAASAAEPASTSRKTSSATRFAKKWRFLPARRPM